MTAISKPPPKTASPGRLMPASGIGAAVGVPSVV
jgi:hypothetical protein